MTPCKFIEHTPRCCTIAKCCAYFPLFILWCLSPHRPWTKSSQTTLGSSQDSVCGVRYPELQSYMEAHQGSPISCPTPDLLGESLTFEKKPTWVLSVSTFQIHWNWPGSLLMYYKSFFTLNPRDVFEQTMYFTLKCLKWGVGKMAQWVKSSSFKQELSMTLGTM